MTSKKSHDVKQRVWGIIGPTILGRGKALYIKTLRTTRKLAIADYVRIPGNSSVDRTIKKRWPKMHKWGYRVVPVTISFKETP